MTKKLENKVAIVTGGSRGIGAATATKLAQQGANVAITYGKSKEEAEKVVAQLTAIGVKAKAYQADANHPEKLPELVKAVLADFGAIDILVNNAGVFTMGGIGYLSQDDYNKVFNINVASVFALTNAVVPHLKSGSRIVNISSVLGERASGPMLGVYNASKFAVTGFSRSWAKDLGAKGITVNAVQPGPIATEMNPDEGEFAEAMKAQIPLARYGKPEEVAAAVAFLASPEASYISGATLNVDGGMNA